jgi:nucleoside-diphosphate-sugar epimerase
MTGGDRGRALVVGVTGISGGNVAHRLLDDGWDVLGLCRRPQAIDGRITPLVADLDDADAVAAAVRGTAPTHVFYTTWSRRSTEAENCAVNGRMLENLLDATGREGSVRHVALVTGLKHYLGPFEAYAKVQPDTPFSEDQGRLPYENFYYVQEDILFAAAERDGFTWSVHRPHTLIGWALGNAMNMGVTLAVYGAICRETGRGFHYPGSREQW